MTNATKMYRKQMVLAMETVARACNDEDVFERWLMGGVADGDITEFDWEQVDDYYIEDDTFAELMGCFGRVMKDAVADGENGAFYSGGIVSRR